MNLIKQAEKITIIRTLGLRIRGLPYNRFLKPQYITAQHNQPLKQFPRIQLQ